MPGGDGVNLYLVQGIDSESTHYFTVRAAGRWEAARLVRHGRQTISVFDGVEHLQRTVDLPERVLHHLIINDRTGEVTHE